MGLVTVQVLDATGNKRQQVQMPDDAPVNRLLVVLLDKLNFPVYAPDGQPRRNVDSQRARALLDFAPRVGLEDGLRRTIAWFESSGG